MNHPERMSDTRRLDDVLADLWLQLLPRDRRALALIGHCNALERRLARDDFMPWRELETADRMALIRAMRVVGELAHTCAIALGEARESLEQHWREDVST